MTPDERTALNEAVCTPEDYCRAFLAVTEVNDAD